MPSTYSPDLRIELIGLGEQAGSWGATTNTNLGTLIEDAISGYVSVSVTSANQALTALNGAADQARNAVLALTTTTGANFAVYAPPTEKTYTVYNASAYTATIYNSTVLGNTTAAGAGVVIPTGKTVTVWTNGTAFAFQNNHISSLTLATDLAVADGGTGASDAGTARTNLGVTATGADTAYAFRANNLSDLASAPSARTSLGLGSIATQNSNAVSVTGGSVTGITDITVADGGTGASTTASARTNLGVAIGSDVQAYDADLTALGGLAKTTGNFIVGNGTTWVAESGATARTSLGLGSIATQNSNAVSVTGGSVTGITDITVADGGTGASSASNARTNLGLTIGADVPSPTGTGASGTWAINITGNAATATSATSAATATSATSATSATNATNLVTAAFSVVESGGKLYFKYGATNIASLDSSGNFTSLANVTAYGTP